MDFHYYASGSTLVDRAVLNKQILNHPWCHGLFVCYPCTCRHSSNYFMNEETILSQSCSFKKKSQSFKITVARLHDIERLHVKSIDCLPWTRTRSLDCLPWTGTWSQKANPESFFFHHQHTCFFRLNLYHGLIKSEDYTICRTTWSN
jgi:hypothetical protein